MNEQTRCPCQSGETLGGCCARFLRAPGEVFAPTAETLMRSRFTAFALGDTDYLLRTWAPEHRPDTLELDPAQEWFRLDIMATEAGGPLERHGVVRFRAHYRYDGVRESFTETSSFVRVGRQWLYVQALADG